MNYTLENQLAEMLKEFQSRSQAKAALVLGLYVLILLLLFLGNSLTLLVMLLNRRMRTIPNMFVASLAVSDVLLGLCSFVPFGIPVLVTSHWLFNDTACQFQGYITIALVVASIHTLVLMAVNRYYRIVKPAKYQRYFTKKKTLIMILVSWFSSFCAPLPHVLSGIKIVFHPAKFFCYFVIEKRAFLHYGSPLYIGVPTCVIIYCYSRIFSTVRNHNRNFHPPNNLISSVNVEDVKVARTIFLVVVFFNLCWIPILTVNVLDDVFQKWIFPTEVYILNSFLGTLSSAVNPLLYGVMNKSFRTNYLKLLRCTYCRSQVVVGTLAR
ncbi:beta-2 adrenergic receptor-like [Porites lutea]|uniref:beta-2 adrenergic receptor-like n=1 Tax=Porites lutea TaxID=51062 RepID=UPI003CC6155F